MTMSSKNNTNRKATFRKESLEKLKVNDLKSLLRKEGLPVFGRKSDLIDRLTNPLYRGPKPKAWQYSDAKKKLKRELLKPESPLHSMSAKEVQNTDESFKRYPKFAKYLSDMKKSIKEEKKQVEDDNIAAKRHLKDCKRSKTRRGYPRWHDHPAKKLLQIDVRKGRHENMSLSSLRETRKEYCEFPKEVFYKRVSAESSKQKAVAFWAHKQNKHGMKRHLQDLAMIE